MNFPGIRSVAQSLSYLERVRDVTANNLANTETVAFKLGRVTAQLNANGDAPIAVQTLDLSQGALKTTGQALDLALEGSGFLVLQTPQGNRLIRGGSFRTDAMGLLVDDYGNPVLGEKGAIPILGQEATIQEDGMVVVDGEVVDRLRVVQADPATLQQVGARQFVSDAALEPVDLTQTRIRQGFLEQANVNSIQSMVDMISTERNYGSNHSALRVLDGVLETIVSSLGRVK